MNEIVDRIIYTTETILKCRHDESLMETNAAGLHDCLGEAVMLAITEQWSACRRRRAPLRKAYYFSAEYLMGGSSTATSITWASWRRCALRSPSAALTWPCWRR